MLTVTEVIDRLRTKGWSEGRITRAVGNPALLETLQRGIIPGENSALLPASGTKEKRKHPGHMTEPSIGLKSKDYRDEEHRGQSLVFFDETRGIPSVIDTYPMLGALFPVPNFFGNLGKMSARLGARLNEEGRKAGVSDLVLLAPCYRPSGTYTMRDAAGYLVQHASPPTLLFHAGVFELKIHPNVPTDEQTEFIRHARNRGNYGVVITADDAESLCDLTMRYLVAYAAGRPISQAEL